jgi:hypothetical protein
VVDDVDPPLDLREEAAGRVAALVAECTIVRTEEPWLRRHGDQHLGAGCREWAQLLVDEADGVGDVLEDVEHEHQVEARLRGGCAAHEPRVVGLQFEIVVVDVPADHLLGAWEVGEEFLTEPAVTGADVEHPARRQGPMLAQNVPVGAEPSDLPRVAFGRRPSFGEIHEPAGYSPDVPMTETLVEPVSSARVGPRPISWHLVIRLLVVLPIVIAAVRAVATGWFPVGDSGLLAVRAADVGTADHPWLGSWTSASLALGVDVNNPGPLYHDLIAPFMWTVGRIAGYGAGVAVGVATVNVLFVLGTLVAAHRIGGWRMERWIALVLAALIWAMGSQLLIDIWQPHALLVPFVCLLVLTVGLITGSWRLMPWWILVVSVIVQTHVAYVYVVAALTVVVVAVGIRRLVADAAHAETSFGVVLAGVVRTPIALASVLVAALAWIQPVIEQVAGPGEGNLQRLATSAGGGELTVGAGTAAKIVAALTAVPPFWARWGWEDTVPSTALTPTAEGPRLVVAGLPGAALAVIGLGLLASVLVALVVLLRSPAQRHARAASALSLLCLTVAVVGVSIQTVTLTGLGNHQVRWIFALAVFVHVCILWGLAELAVERHPAIRRGEPVLIAVIVALVVASVPFHAHDLGPTADRDAARTLERVFDDLTEFEPGGPVNYDTSNLRVFEPYSGAVLMRLRELGVPFRFGAEGDIRQFGEHRRADGSEVGTLRQYESVEALLYAGDGCTVSLRSRLSPDEEATVDDLIDAARDDLVGTPIDTRGLPDDVADLVERAAAGDPASAHAVVAFGILPMLAEEVRLDATPAIRAAVAANEAISSRVTTTLRLVVSPASLC